jgi:hypothetical protein
MNHWRGPLIVYLLCYPRKTNYNYIDEEPEFIAKVTPVHDMEIQVWQTGRKFIYFTGRIKFIDSTGFCANKYYKTKEISVPVAETHIEFKTFPSYDVNGSEMRSYYLPLSI